MSSFKIKALSTPWICTDGVQILTKCALSKWKKPCRRFRQGF